MTDARRPRVSIGLAVHNGGTYLVEALASLLGQTYTDFELIISDNASEDQTPRICQEFADQDSRIRYHRNATNIGGFRNHNLVFRMSRGEYFMYAAHDDVRAPDYVERCVRVLDANPAIVLCYTKTRYIDAQSRPLGLTEVELRIAADRPSERFREMIRRDHKIEPIFGLIRSRVMARTGLQRQFADSDRVFLAELALYGRFHRLADYLMFRREHPAQSTKLHPLRQDRIAWFDPAARRRLTFPHFRQFREYVAAITRTPLPYREKLACYRLMAPWVVANAAFLRWDVSFALRETVGPWLPDPVRRAVRAVRQLQAR